MKTVAKSRKRFFIWAILIAGLIVVIFPALFIILLPVIATNVNYPEVEIDLPTNVTQKISKFTTRQSVTAKIRIQRGTDCDFEIESKGRVLDWKYTLAAKTDYSVLDAEAKSRFVFSLDGTPWKITGTASATPRTWKAEAELSQTKFTECDPLLKPVLSNLGLHMVSNLVFSGSLRANLSAAKTKKIQVPVWTVRGRISDVNASCGIGGKPLSLERFSTSFGADGIADRKTVLPLYPRIASAGYNGFSVTNVSASILTTEKSLLVTEAGAEFCGGEIKLYSLFLDPARLTTGFTLFLDGIDTNEVVSHLRGFRGNATGKLHGKIPVFLKDGKKLKLRNSYLYSIPGECGTLQLLDAKPIIDNLTATGVDEATTSNLSKALTNLTYTSLKFDIKRDDDGSLALVLSIEGSATHNEITVPVSLAVTIHGDLEQLINTGLKIKGG